MQQDEREPGAERPDTDPDASTAASPPAGADPTGPADQAGQADQAGRDETPAEAEVWPSEPGPDTTESARSSAPSTQPPPPSEVEAYPAAGQRPSGAAAASTAGTSAHSVPSTQAAVGESTTQCPRCGTENPPGLSFCRSCGQRLVAAGVATTVERPSAPDGSMACPRCGTHNRAGVAFCQNCGANLRGVGSGYVASSAVGTDEGQARRRAGAVLGPAVLLIGLIGLVTGYLLPFAYGSGSLWERAAGADGYGVAFWAGYPEVAAGLADQAYFGLAAPVPLLGVLIVALAIAGFVRATPGPVQTVGLAIALLWSVGLVVLFVVVELAGNWGGDLVGLLRELTPAGIILFLSSLIVLIGALTRFGRS